MSAPPSTARARLLLEQGRHDEAAATFRELLASDPESVAALVGLAFCLYHGDKPAHHREGLEVARRAAALAPEDPEVAFVRGLLQLETRDVGGARESMDRAIALAPDNARFFGGKALTYLRQERWSDAERWAREGLSLDPEDTTCSNALASALLMRGDTGGHASQVGELLRRNPEDPHAHFNMGMAALRSGDHRVAEGHFKEALRLDPGFEPARSGLLEAFRSRSPFYRGFLKLSYKLAQMPPRTRTLTLLGAYFAYRIARKAAEDTAPIAATVLGILWVSFALFSFLGRGLGNLIILKDRVARHALDRTERWEGLLVGGGLVAGFALLIGGVAASLPGLVTAGACCIAPAVPASVAFGSGHPHGRWFYGIAASVVALCGAVVFADAMTHLDIADPSAWALPFFLAGLVVALASAWAAFFGFKT